MIFITGPFFVSEPLQPQRNVPPLREYAYVTMPIYRLGRYRH